MKKYAVTITESYYKTFHILAANEQEAEDKVLDDLGTEIAGKTLSFDVEVEEF